MFHGTGVGFNQVGDPLDPRSVYRQVVISLMFVTVRASCMTNIGERASAKADTKSNQQPGERQQTRNVSKSTWMHSLLALSIRFSQSFVSFARKRKLKPHIVI